MALEPLNPHPDDDVTVSRVGELVTVDFGDGDKEAPADLEDMGENLADKLDPTELATLAVELLEHIDADIASREEWQHRMRRGLEVMGLKPDADYEPPFEGASEVNHPLLAEGVVQFQSRAVTEIFPPAGPVKVIVVGDSNDETEEQRDRVEKHMNYQLTIEDKGYFPDVDKMLFRLPIEGSVFKKCFYDPLTDKVKARAVRANDFIVPYHATSLEDAERGTERLRLSANEIKKLQAVGYYRETQMAAQPPSQEPIGDLDEAIDQTESRTPGDHPDQFRYPAYESHCIWDLPGALADPHRIARPYIITIDVDNQDILAIRRNWREGDPLKQKRQYFVHYQYLPGLGFYGYGLFHMIGGLNEAATGALRALLDSAAFATLQGGFKASDASVKGGDMELSPGEWKDIDLTAEELSKAFHSPPFKEPSQTLFHLLGLLVDSGQRFSSTTEAMVGDASNQGPVGTTVALIEQGSKVYSAIHKRVHFSAGCEFSCLALLNGEYLPDDPDTFTIEGEQHDISRADYDERVDVQPVSDPNIFSSTQRIAIAQSTLQMAQGAPQLYDMYEVHRRMHVAMRTPAMDEILLDPDNVEHMDPMTENAAIMIGRGVKAFPEQDHGAHIAVHMSFLQHPQFGGNKQAQKMIGPAMIAHIAQHVGYKYVVEMGMQGVPVQLPNLAGQRKDKLLLAPADPRTENAMAQQQAGAVQLFMKMTGVPEAQQDQQNAEAAKAQIEMKKLELKNAEMELDHKEKVLELKADAMDTKAKLESQEQIAAQKSEIEELKAQLADMKADEDRDLKRHEIKVKADIEYAKLETQRDIKAADDGYRDIEATIEREDPDDPLSPAKRIKARMKIPKKAENEKEAST